MNLYEVKKVDGSSFMVNLEKIESLEVLPDRVKITMVSGTSYSITHETISAALSHSKINFYNIEKKEEIEKENN